MNDAATPVLTFHEQMAASLAGNYDIAGSVIYEVGSDARLAGARALVQRGAKMVLATNLGRNWIFDPAEKVAAIQSDVRTADKVIGGNTVDAVFGINILEHINDLPAALAAIRAILRPGGCFLLHGHPIWTCAHGHHAYWVRDDARYVFSEDSNPLPDWCQLYMTPDEMLAHLAANGISREDAEGIVEFTARSDRLNRLPLRTIREAFEQSGLIIDRTVSNDGPSPPPDIAARIAAGPWHDPAENYAVRQVTFLGRK